MIREAQTKAVAVLCGSSTSLLDDHDAQEMDAAAAEGMRLPPLTEEVEHGIRNCFQLFSARSHADLISSVCAGACLRIQAVES